MFPYLLVTPALGSSATLAHLLDGPVWGDFLAELGDQALGAVTVCAVVAVLHTIVYGAMRAGRPETRGARGVRAGLVLLLGLDVLPLPVQGVAALVMTPLR
ncbi:hypothetical protein ABZ619_29480 [Streptomyces sp. NPDC007851]|uniref:hypothetical protein n=1 Tax=Streptomyces sp. NPDC007851 TaxID=3155008 RepID=UPI0033C271B0